MSFAEIWLILRKDLLIEWRSRVMVNQLAPLGLLILVLFAFATNADAVRLKQFAPGLFWIAVLMTSMMAVQRTFSLEADDDVVVGLRMSGLASGSIFLGKALAIMLELLLLEAILGLGIVVFYDVQVSEAGLALVALVVPAAALAAAGTIYGALSLGIRVRETLLPLLFIPVAAPVLLGATRALESATGVSTVGGWGWVALVAGIALLYGSLGVLFFGSLLEES